MITAGLPCLHGFGTREETPWTTGNVLENRVAMSRQTHSDIVRTVTEPGQPPEPCDALVTKEKGLALCIYTADCVPVLLVDPEAGLIGAAHAGWRGTANGIVAKTVQTMAELGAEPARIQAAIGPAIGQCCFETHDDVPDALWQSLGAAVSPLMKKQADRWHINLKGVNELWLRQSGVRAIDISELCTSCNIDVFYSFRREKTGGRQFSFICLGDTAQCAN